MKDLAPNTTVSHYRIVAQIGAGGMGQVYLAQDTKLDRKVALKTLPADLASQADRMRRFVQEAKAAAAPETFSAAQLADFNWGQAEADDVAAALNNLES